MYLLEPQLKISMINLFMNYTHRQFQRNNKKKQTNNLRIELKMKQKQQKMNYIIYTYIYSINDHFTS